MDLAGGLAAADDAVGAEGNGAVPGQQRGDGSWDEELATGTGFPRVFYLNYHLYKDYFPLLALSTYVKARAASNG